MKKHYEQQLRAFVEKQSKLEKDLENSRRDHERLRKHADVKKMAYEKENTCMLIVIWLIMIFIAKTEELNKTQILLKQTKEQLSISSQKLMSHNSKGDAEKNKYVKIIDDFKMANKILKEEIREKDKEFKQLQEEKELNDTAQDSTIDKQVFFKPNILPLKTRLNSLILC